MELKWKGRSCSGREEGIKCEIGRRAGRRK